MALRYDAKTGKMRRVNPLRSRIAKRAAMKRRNKPIKRSSIMKAMRTRAKNRRTGRNKFGKKLRRR